MPNHIDRVLESVKSHPEIWGAAWNEARLASRDAALGAVRLSARDAARYAALGAALGAARYAAWNAAWGAIAALIAYDDASKYLDMPSDQLRVWAILSEDPAAILLLPAVIAFERINELELA
jgi:hypothetical protein